MSSFVTDVLVTAEKLEKVNLPKNIAEIEKEIKKLEFEVKDFMDENYVEVNAKLIRDAHLVKKTEQLLTDIDALKSRINDQIKIKLSGSTEELQTLSQTLKESHMSLQLSHHLITFHECIKSIKKSQEEKRYVDSTKTLQQMQNLFDNPCDVLPDLKIYCAIKDEYCNLFRLFVMNASKLLNDQICLNKDEKNNKTSIIIENEYDDLQELMQGLHMIDNLENELETFSTRLMDFIISPITQDCCTIYVVKEKTFTIEISKEKKTMQYNRVLYNLTLLFKFLHQHLNIIIADNESFLKKLQPHLLGRLSHSLITNCISHTIPASNADLKNFDGVKTTINEFQDYLVDIEFLSKDHLFLSDYTNNIDKLFIDKMCRDILVKARDIIRKDLHNTFLHKPQEPPNIFNETEKNRELTVGKKLSDMSFQLPKCQISKNAQELLELAKEVLNEVCNSSDTCAIRLFYTCRNIFEMYVGIVPEYYKKFLATIPQQAALFHNNCMYLAHYLMTLAHEYKDKFPANLRTSNLTFADQVVVFRDVGSQHFLQIMEHQANIVSGIIKDSGFSALGQTPHLDPDTERSLRQCIMILELLKTAWLDVLPINVYCKSIGCITNSMIDDLVTKVISVEDIPANVSTELVKLFNMVINRTPQIFPDPDKIQQYVRKWGKFLELLKILAASLKEIELRWGNGKGPLALSFTAAQVKQLIRALFQNTDRRSNLLAIIK